MKSYASFLEGLYLSILRDVEGTYPRDAIEWSRDLSRLRSAMKYRGTRFFTVDLPSMGKHFDKCLSLEALTLSGLPFQGAQKRDSAIPGLFRGLLRKVFHDNGSIRSSVDITAVHFLRELYYAAKKLRQECPESAVFTTVADFFDVEHGCRRPTLEWDSDNLDTNGLGAKVGFSDLVATPETIPEQLQLFEEEQFSRSDVPCLTTLQRVCDWVVGGQFGPVNWTGLRPKHGPGAVADARVGRDDKYRFPHWPSKLEQIFPIQEYGYANLSAWEADHDNTLPTNWCPSQDNPEDSDVVDKSLKNSLSDILYRHHEPPSRLIAVPKTQKGPRLIASEPISHQWMQQALKRELECMVERSVLRHSISFASQEPSRRDALKSSRDGMRATIDLSSASDRLTCYVVERTFRSHGDLLSAFHAVRTRWLVNNIDKKRPKYTILRKFAPMGSALTFPVQSICYALFAISSVISTRNWEVTRASIETAARQVRVYGDDIIIPVDCYGVCVQLLTQLGLKVNTDKTFSRGKFRESCGMDAYAGEEVTPAYVLEVCDKTRPETVISTVEASNNFFKKGFWRTAEYLKSTVPKELRKHIPVVSPVSGAFGWTSFVGADISGCKSRYNKDLHRQEFRSLALRTRNAILPTDGWSSLHQFFTDNPSPLEKWEAGVRSKPKVSLSLRWVAADEAVRETLPA